MYKRIEKSRVSDERKNNEDKNTSEEESRKYDEYLSSSKNYLSSARYTPNYQFQNSQEFSDVNEENNTYNYQSKINGFSREEESKKQKKSDDNFTDHVKSPTFLNVESQYLERENNNIINESSQFKPKALEFERISNYSSNFNTRYNNLNNHFLENSEQKRKTEKNYNETDGKKEQNKFIHPKELESKDFKYTKGGEIFKKYL